jgi:preprotein translocase subunit YajC
MINQLLGLILMAPQGGGADGGQSMTSFLVMMGSIVVIFYFLIFRPQKKRQKQRDEELSKIDKGDKVILSGGMHGTISAIEEKTVLITVAENTKIRFEKSAISSVVPK